MERTIKIGNMFVGLDYPPCIIAEMSGNHNQSLGRKFSCDIRKGTPMSWEYMA